MKISRMVGLATVTAILLLGWLFQQATRVDVAAHVRNVERFRQIKQLDATLDLYVLESHDGLLGNYDALIQVQQQIDVLLAEIEADAPQYFAGASAPLSTAFADYWRIRQDKNHLIDTFKSHNAVLRNSLSYLPVAIHAQLQNGTHSVRIRETLYELLSDVLIFNQVPSRHNREPIALHLGMLVHESGLSGEVSNLQSHVLLIEAYKDEVDDLIRQISSAQAKLRGDELFHAYNKLYLVEEEQALRYKIALLMLTLTLVGYVSWLVLRLAKARNELKKSLVELEFQKYTLDQHSIVSIADRGGKIIYTNDKFSEISHYRREELLGQDHRLLNSGYHPPAFFKNMWLTIGHGKVWRGEICNRAKDGSLYWVESTIVPFMDELGKPSRYVSIRTDITARKALEDALQSQRDFYERISETLGEGLYVQDTDGRCSFMNSEAERLLGWKRREFIGKPVHDTIHSLTAAGLPLSASDCPINKIAQPGQRMINEDQVFVRRDGSTFPVALVAQGIFKNGEYQGTVVAFHDISLRKNAEAALVSAKEAAEAASRAKSDFLANMSHEIRTPMNGIIGMTNLALETELDAEQREYIGLVKTSADALLNIINDILDFSKIEAGKMELERVDFCLTDLLTQTTRTIALRAHQKGLELLLDIDPAIPEIMIGDPGRVRQVLVNLVGNAIKFTEQGEIAVTANLVSVAQGDARIHVSVRDTGIGIPEHKFREIFESFSQADTSTTRKYGGTGLGLTITSLLVELMGGRIWLESEEGKGSTFHVELVLERPLDGIQPQYETMQLVGMSVLVADDNASGRQLAVELLQRWGMRVQAVEGGQEAVAELERAARAGDPYRLLLLDARMWPVDGFMVAEQLRTQPELAVTTVMMLTSDRQRGEVARCGELGIPAYLLKPYSQSDLFDALMDALGLAEIQHVSQEIGHELRRNRRKLHVLLAEDNSINQTLATRLLQKFGHSVDIAGNGLIAVEKWQAGQYDLILMDVDMPELNGYGATARIRELERLRGDRALIVGLTAHAMQGSREECLRAGMDGYLSKPIDIDALWAELEAVATHGAQVDAGEADTTEVQGWTFEMDRSLALMDNDMALFREMVQIYLEEYPALVEGLGRAIACGDAGETRHVAHTLKGMLSVFAVPAVAEIAERIERQLTRDQQEDYRVLREALDRLAQELRDALAHTSS